MKRPSEKDLYSILGVAPDVTPEEIRNAYLARTRVIHPDRFDQQSQPQDWKKANEMLAELNEAYSILRNVASRAEYDQFRSGKRMRETSPPPGPKPEPQPPPSASFELGELTPGHVSFARLPKNVKERLLNRQQNKTEDQFQVKLSSIVWSYLFIAILLCWFWYLFYDADGVKWKENTLMWYAGLTLGVGALIARKCVTIGRWLKAKLKPYFYITPIYFIKTDFDIVSFRPIWTLKDVAVTHNYKNGIHQNSDVVLKFDGYDEPLSLSSKKKVDTMFERLRTYDTRLRAAHANGDYRYFLDNDDFYKVPRSGVPTTALLSKGKRAFIYAASLLVCVAGLFAAIAANEEFSRKRWARHPTPSEYMPSPTLPQQPVKSSHPEHPLPHSGRVQVYTTEDQIAPFQIKAAQGSHYLLKLVDTNKHTPVLTVFVQSGTTVEVEVPLGTYEVRYASGETWYGDEYLFGPETSYSKANKAFTFQIVDNQISGFTITLYKVAHGNLHTSRIRPMDF